MPNDMDMTQGSINMGGSSRSTNSTITSGIFNENKSFEKNSSTNSTMQRFNELNKEAV